MSWLHGDGITVETQYGFQIRRISHCKTAKRLLNGPPHFVVPIKVVLIPGPAVVRR